MVIENETSIGSCACTARGHKLGLLACRMVVGQSLFLVADVGIQPGQLERQAPAKNGAL